MMAQAKFWKFSDYCSEAGTNLIQAWYDDQPVEAQADFDVTLNNLAGLRDWRGLNEFKLLKGKHQKLGEIRFKTLNVQYRPVGCFGPGQREFTILVGCIKKQNVYQPPDAFDLALKRRSLLRQGRASTNERDL